MKVIELLNESKKPVWHDSDAPDANGKFKELSVGDLADWLIKTRHGNLQKINGSLQQQIVFNRNRDPAYAKKMSSTLAAVKRKLNITEDLDDDKREKYKRWKQLVNMSASEIESFKTAQLQRAKEDPKKYPGLRPSEASQLHISSGVQSAEWIIKMKNTPVAEWTPQMWKWAGKQISFISRMLGNDGPLEKDGQPTRKLLSLKIWGHNPNKG